MNNPQQINERIERLIFEALARLTSKKPPASGDLFGPEKVLDSVAMISFLNEVEKGFYREFGQAAGIFQSGFKEQAGVFTNTQKLRAFLIKKLGY